MKVSKFQGLLVLLGEAHKMAEAYKNEGEANFAQVSGLIRQAVGKIDPTSALALGNEAKAEAPKRATFNTTPPPYKGSAQKAKGGKPVAPPLKPADGAIEVGRVDGQEPGEEGEEEIVEEEVGFDNDPTISKIASLPDAKAVVSEFSSETLLGIAEIYGIEIPANNKNAMQIAARIRTYIQQRRQAQNDKNEQ